MRRERQVVRSVRGYAEKFFDRRCATKPQRKFFHLRLYGSGGGELSLIVNMAPCGWRVQFELGEDISDC